MIVKGCAVKSYGQLCAVARALDVVGDRWTLLLVRELLTSGSLRFTQLQRGLPGIAPNLLAQRLRDLEAAGVLQRDLGGAGEPATYGLTARGAALEGVVRELLRWGAPTVPSAPADAVFQMHWLSQPARYLLHDHRPTDGPVTVRFGDASDGFDVTADRGQVQVGPCTPDAEVATTVTGPGHVLVALLQGALPLRRALTQGVGLDGSRDALQRLLPV